MKVACKPSYLLTMCACTRINYLKRFIMKKIIFLIAMFVTVCAFMISCNVTRVVTNESSYLQRGDTAVTIHTKTIESYDASKKDVLFK